MVAEGWEAARGVAARGAAARVEEAKEVAAAAGVVVVGLADRQVAQLVDTMVAGTMVVASGEGVRVEAAEAEGGLVEGAEAGVTTVVAIRVAETAVELATGERATAAACKARRRGDSTRGRIQCRRKYHRKCRSSRRQYSRMAVGWPAAAEAAAVAWAAAARGAAARATAAREQPG